MRPIVLLGASLAFVSAIPSSFADEARWLTQSSFVERASETSLATIVERARTVEVTYAGPEGGFAARAGVLAGTLIFKGARRGNFVSGTAYFFRSGCPPIPYHVQGNFKHESLALKGAAPVMQDGVSCAILRYDDSPSNASLLFSRIPEPFGASEYICTPSGGGIKAQCRLKSGA